MAKATLMFEHYTDVNEWKKSLYSSIISNEYLI